MRSSVGGSTGTGVNAVFRRRRHGRMRQLTEVQMLKIFIVLVIALIVFGPMLLKVRKNTDEQPFPVNAREGSDVTITRNNGERFKGS